MKVVRYFLLRVHQQSPAKIGPAFSDISQNKQTVRQTDKNLLHFHQCHAKQS